jgi:hypothetical protein
MLHVAVIHRHGVLRGRMTSTEAQQQGDRHRAGWDVADHGLVPEIQNAEFKTACARSR